MKKQKNVPVNPIEKDNDEIVFNLAANAANDDWIRAARLLREGRQKQFVEMLEPYPSFGFKFQIYDPSEEID